MTSSDESGNCVYSPTWRPEYLGNSLKLRCRFGIIGFALNRSFSGKVSKRAEMRFKTSNGKSRLTILHHRRLFMLLKKRVFINVTLIGLAFISTSNVLACNSIVLTNGVDTYFAKSQEAGNITPYAIVNKKGVFKTAFMRDDWNEENPMKWVSRYGSVALTAIAQDMPFGGMNEEGLAIEHLANQAANIWPTTSDSKSALNEWQWMQYLLDTCKTVDEAIIAHNNLRIRPFGFRIHFILADATGNAAIIEYLNQGALFIYVLNNNDMPEHMTVLCNKDYNRSTSYMQNFIPWGGSRPMPALSSNDALDRFAISCFYVYNFNNTPDPKPDAIDYCYGYIDDLSRQRGGQIYGQIYEPRNKLIHYRLTKSPSNRKTIDFSQIDFSTNSADTTQWIALADDVTNPERWFDYNETVARKVLTDFAAMVSKIPPYTAFNGIVNDIVTYPSSFVFDYLSRPPVTKWNPGHYTFINMRSPSDFFITNPSEITDLDELVFDRQFLDQFIDGLGTSFQGIEISVVWRMLEPTKDNYDFSFIDEALDVVNQNDKHLILLLADRMLSEAFLPVPDYLTEDPQYGGGYALFGNGGLTTAFWNENVLERYWKLMRELGRRYNGTDNVEVITFSESALSFDSQPVPVGYTSENYIAYLQERVEVAREAFPNTLVKQGFNWGYTGIIPEHSYNHFVGFHGPDVVPDDERYPTKNRIAAYEYYEQYAGILPMSCDVQSPELRKPVAEWGEFTIEGIYHMGVDVLKLNHMCWDVIEWGINYYSFSNDIKPYIDSKAGDIKNTAYPTYGSADITFPKGPGPVQSQSKSQAGFGA